MKDCIFCKIIAGDLPSAQVFSDDRTMVFLDIAPFEKGHALVIPRFHAELLTELPADDVRAVALSVQRMGELLLRNLPCDGFNVLQSNGECATQVVPHVHFHVVPRWNKRAVNWIPGKYESTAEMRELAAQLRGEQG